MSLNRTEPFVFMQELISCLCIIILLISKKNTQIWIILTNIGDSSYCPFSSTTFLHLNSWEMICDVYLLSSEVLVVGGFSLWCNFQCCPVCPISANLISMVVFEAPPRTSFFVPTTTL